VHLVVHAERAEREGVVFRLPADVSCTSGLEFLQQVRVAAVLVGVVGLGAQRVGPGVDFMKPFRPTFTGNF
jgi:hypothetical protein